MSVLEGDEYRRLASAEFNGYGPAPFPDNRDDVLVRIIDRVRDRETYLKTSKNLTVDHAQVFACFALRGAALAVRQGRSRGNVGADARWRDGSR